MIGVEFGFETKELVAEMMKRGVLANATAGNVLRLVPPLVIQDQEIRHLVSVILESLNEISRKMKEAKQASKVRTSNAIH